MQGCWDERFFIPESVWCIAAKDDSWNVFQMNAIKKIVHNLSWQRFGCAVPGAHTKHSNVFSAEGVIFNENLDFRNGIEMFFLIPKETRVILDLTNDRNFMKVHGEEPIQGKAHN